MKAAVLAIALAAALAQQPAPSRAEGQQPVFKSGINVVRFDIRVTDAQGRPIKDLRPDEVRVVENGQSLPVLLFQHVDEPAGSYADAALKAVSAEITSNEATPRGHLYILAFDQQHITAGNEQIARLAAQRFIETRVRPSDRVAVIGLPGPGPALGFTADRKRAMAALATVRGGLERNAQTAMGRVSVQEAYEIASGNDRVLDDVLLRYSSDPTADVASSTVTPTVAAARASAQEDIEVTRRLLKENARTLVAASDAESRQFLQRLADLIEQYRTIEGRKTIVLFSEGFHQQNVTRELQDVEAAAAQSYAVFYAFDLNRRRSDLEQQQLPSTDQSMEIQERVEPLGSLAAETDGVLVNDAATHLDEALNKLADQAQDYYLVGFAPSSAALAARGEYRRVSVQVTRPGAHVSARTGYALPRSATPLDRRRAIDAALGAPFVQQALKVEYTTYVLRSDTSTRARVVLSLDAQLPIASDPNQKADVVFVVRDTQDGRVVASGTDVMPMPRAASSAASTGASHYRVQVDVPPGSYMMRAVVHEPGGLVGSADRRFDVRSLAGPDVAVSDIILGSAGGALPVHPTAYASDGVNGLVEAYARAPEQLQNLVVTASLTRADSDAVVGSVRADLGDVTTSAGSPMRRAMFSVPLNSVAPGAYVARVRVVAGGEPVADLTREVEVEPGAAPAAASRPPAEPEIRPSDILNGDFVRPAVAWAQSGTTPGATQALAGFRAFADHRYAEAESALAQSLKLDSTHAAVAFVLGWASEASGNHTAAIGAWRAAATIDPRMVPAHLALADAYIRLSQPALAVQALHAGLAALPQSAELQAKLAQLEKK